MGVYIKDMEMPTSCRDCDFMNWGAVEPNRCGITDCFIGGDYDKRHDNCPLVPVPPHGRLIDADALAEHKFVCIPHVSIDGKDVGTAYRLGWNTAIEAVMENAETIMGGE